MMQHIRRARRLPRGLQRSPETNERCDYLAARTKPASELLLQSRQKNNRLKAKSDKAYSEDDKFCTTRAGYPWEREINAFKLWTSY